MAENSRVILDTSECTMSPRLIPVRNHLKKAASVWRSSSKPEKKMKELTAGEEVDKDSAVKKIWSVFLSKEYNPEFPAGRAAYWLMITILWVTNLVICTMIVGVVPGYIAAKV